MNNATNYINVYPITKGKRFLVWACDCIITFVLAYVFCIAAISPLISKISNYDQLVLEGNQAQLECNEILEDAELIYFENESDKSNINLGMEYTYKLFLQSCIQSNDTFNPFIKYYGETYFERALLFDAESSFFVFNSDTKKVSLNSRCFNLLYPLVNVNDSLSEDGQNLYDEVYTSYFKVFYVHMLEDIKNNSFPYISKAYSEKYCIVEKMNKQFDLIVLISSIISFALSFAFLDFVVPLFNKGHRTVSMIMMRIYRIDLERFAFISKTKFIITAFYSLIVSLIPFFLLGYPMYNFNFLFAMPGLFIPSLISLILCTISLFIMIFSRTNQAMSDNLTDTIFVDNECLDNIYKSKGYVL